MNLGFNTRNFYLIRNYREELRVNREVILLHEISENCLTDFSFWTSSAKIDRLSEERTVK